MRSEGVLHRDWGKRQKADECLRSLPVALLRRTMCSCCWAIQAPPIGRLCVVVLLQQPTPTLLLLAAAVVVVLFLSSSFSYYYCRGRNEAADEADREHFMQELEEDADMRARVALFKDPAALAAAAAAATGMAEADDSDDDDDGEGLPQVGFGVCVCIAAVVLHCCSGGWVVWHQT